MLRSNTAGPLRPLTRALALGMVEFPNFARRSKRLSSIPNAGRSLAAQTAFAVNAPAGRMPGGLLAHIGRVVTSSIREDWRLRLSRGALYPAFFISPESNEVPMHSIPFSAPRPAVAVRPCPSSSTSWPVPVKLPPLWPCWARRCPRRPVFAGPCSVIS